MQLVFHRPFLILCSVNTCFGATLILLWYLHRYSNQFLPLERTIEIIFHQFHPRIKTITIHLWDTLYRLMIILSIIRMLIFILQLILTIKTTTGIYNVKFIAWILIDNFVILQQATFNSTISFVFQVQSEKKDNFMISMAPMKTKIIVMTILHYWWLVETEMMDPLFSLLIMFKSLMLGNFRCQHKLSLN